MNWFGGGLIIIINYAQGEGSITPPVENNFLLMDGTDLLLQNDGTNFLLQG